MTDTPFNSTSAPKILHMGVGEYTGTPAASPVDLQAENARLRSEHDKLQGLLIDNVHDVRTALHGSSSALATTPKEAHELTVRGVARLRSLLADCRRELEHHRFGDDAHDNRDWGCGENPHVSALLADLDAALEGDQADCETCGKPYEKVKTVEYVEADTPCSDCGGSGCDCGVSPDHRACCTGPCPTCTKNPDA